jgi:D-alanine-D-alanine ligase
MKQKSLDKSNHPSGKDNNRPPWRIALVANLKSGFVIEVSDPPDAGSEFDSIQTLQTIANALESEGHCVQILEADSSLPAAMLKVRPQICFNIAEGLQGNGREALVPALCELLGIPYTASRVVSSAICLEKTLSKRIWRDAGLPTANFLEASSTTDLDQIAFDFPMFVKPSREGSGMGVTQNSIVNNLEELFKEVSSITSLYRQPALVEEFLPGREFTVGFIGNPGSPANRPNHRLYDQDGYHWFPIMEIDAHNSISPAVYGHEAKSKDVGTDGAPDYLCPADIPDLLKDQLITLTKKAAQVLGICDVSRVDFRIGADQKPYLLEINTLPGLNPDLSDLCIMAAAEGLDYKILINEILYLAAERFQLPLPQEPKGRRTGAAGFVIPARQDLVLYERDQNR